MHPTSINWSSPEWMAQAPLMNGESIEGFGFAIEGWQESTSLFDRSGVEIYEGDILTDDGFGGSVDKPILQVMRWDKTSWEPSSLFLNWDKCILSCKVIGNIHQHKHLLEG
jgi:uncharacterized phage protein (TIGR01671 family)